MIGGIAESGSLVALLQNAGQVRSQMDRLNAQASSGRVADTYGGLGAQARTSLDLRPQQTKIAAWQTNVDQATGRMGVAQTALDQIATVASSFVSKVQTLNGLDSGTVDSVAAAARDALKQVAGLLNTQDGGTYVFAGTDGSNAPVPNPDGILSSGYYTQIGAAVSGLAGSDAATVSAATQTVAQSDAAGDSPFSATLLSGAAIPAVEIGDGQYVQTGLLADRNTVATSGSASATGSWARDLMRSLATLGSLSSGQIGAAGFKDLVADTRTQLTGVVSTLGVEQGIMGDLQTRLTDTRTNLGDQSTALSKQLSSVEDVDMAKTLSDLEQTKTQLQASYQIIAAMRELSLTKFL